MKIKFLGAAGTVTGSCYALEAGGHRFAIDCGMHQGNTEIEKRNRDMEVYAPEHIEFVLLTHAHIDHTGLLPRLVKEGFRGKIYATEPTHDLLEIMLLDSAHIQEMEAEWQSRKRARKGSQPVAPLYTEKDALETMTLFSPVKYGEFFEPAPGVRVKYMDAGHILGSAIIEIFVMNGEREIKLVFSGDLGRPDQLLVKDPSIVKEADFLFMESTYGDREHKNEAGTRDELALAINEAARRGGKVIIPAFAVERSQELIYSISCLLRDGLIPKDIPVFLDSPMAIRATEVFKQHPEYLDEDTHALLRDGEHPLEMPNLKLTLSTEESRAINTYKGPAIVISASGMANAGRIKHHLRHNLWRPEASIVIVGYQAEGTPGRQIVDGAKKIALFGEDIAVKARVYTLGGFSAHAGQGQMLEWLGNFQNPAMKVFLVHGERKAQEVFAGIIRKRFGFEVRMPDYLEECVLVPGEILETRMDVQRARPAVDWDYLLRDTDRLLGDFRARLKEVREKPWISQTEVRDRLVEVNNALIKLVSEM